MEVSVVSAQAVLVNWTLDMEHKGDKGNIKGNEINKVQLEIVYSPVQARWVSWEISVSLFDLLLNKTKKFWLQLNSWPFFEVNGQSELSYKISMNDITKNMYFVWMTLQDFLFCFT